MAKLRISIAATLLLFGTPSIGQEPRRPLPEARTPAEAAAQYQRGYSGPRSPDATGNNPGTTALNSAVAAASASRIERNAEAEAQYAADMEAYRRAADAHARQASRDEARYQNQQRAYADAMFAWRMQVAACERGRVKQCRAPTPDPADFY